jgi:hypothetical protein
MDHSKPRAATVSLANFAPPAAAAAVAAVAEPKKAGESGNKKTKIILQVEKRFQQNAQHDASLEAGRKGVDGKDADKDHAKPKHDADMEHEQGMKAQRDSAATKKRKFPETEDVDMSKEDGKGDTPATHQGYVWDREGCRAQTEKTNMLTGDILLQSTPPRPPPTPFAGFAISGDDKDKEHD